MPKVFLRLGYVGYYPTYPLDAVRCVRYSSDLNHEQFRYPSKLIFNKGIEMTDISQMAQVILAGMISLVPPGKTVYSRTVIENCDSQCQAAPVCTHPSLLCSPPKFSQEIYDMNLDLSKKDRMSVSEWEKYEEKIRNSSFTRAENYEEGLQRYVVIAKAIEEVSTKITWGKINTKCKEECSAAPNSANCKLCRRARPWTGTEKDLAASIVTIFMYEGGFRQDVQSGIGPLSRGDCKWENVTTHKRVPAHSKGAHPIKSTCRSVCLAQINIGPDIKFGYQAKDLVGQDLESTMRCAEVAGRMLAQSRNRCSGPNVDYTGDWVAGMFAAYGTGGVCRPSVGTGAGMKHAIWPAKRAGTFRRVLNATPALSAEIQQALGIAAAGPLALGD